MAKKIEVEEITPIEPDKVEKTSSRSIQSKNTSSKSYRPWRIVRIFWGLLLILLGGLILASNNGLLSLNWFNLWRLWPLFIIMIGVYVITTRGWAGRLLSIVVVILALGAVTYALVYSPQDARQTSSYNVLAQKIDLAADAEINLKAGLEQLDVNSTDQSDVVRANLESNISNLTSDVTMAGATQVVNLKSDVTDNWAAGNVDNRLSLNVTRKLPLSLNLDIGASNINADLSLARLQSLNIKSSATKSDIKLGDIENVTTVNLDSGASAFIIRVPATSGVRVKLSGLTSNNLNGFVKNGDTYESTNYGSATKKINVIGRLGLASFQLEQY